MEKFAGQILDLLDQAIFAYQDLQQVLEAEKGHIDAMDIDALWKTTARKKGLLQTIDAVKQALRRLADGRADRLGRNREMFSPADLIQSLPETPSGKSQLRHRLTALANIESHVTVLARDNQTRIKQYLSVIDDIFSTVTDTGRNRQYTPAGAYTAAGASRRFVSAEV